MRKAFIIMIAAALLVGVPGCGGGSTEQDSQTMVEIMNADNIVNAINAYNVLYPGSALSDNVTLADAKEVLGELWPRGISYEEAEKASKWIVISNGKASLTREAQKEWDKLAG